MINLKKYLNSIYENFDDNIFSSNRSVNNFDLKKNLNSDFLKILSENDCKTTIKLCEPNFDEMVFSTKREASLELLDHSNEGVCIDYGAKWGILSIGMARRGHQVIALDQNYKYLSFLKSRYSEEGLDNIYLVHDYLDEVKFKNIADYVLLNGVLGFLAKKNKNSKKKQVLFLNKIYENLNENGQLLIGIENKLSYKNLIGRTNRYTYSFNEINKLLKDAGFKQIDDYCCFPSYEFPSLIVPNSKNGIKEYYVYDDNNIFGWNKESMSKYLEIFLMKYLKAKVFCPAIIIIAKK